MEKRPRIIIAICLVLSIISIGYILSVKGKPQTGKTGYPLPLAIAKPPQEISVGSPDGNWTLTMKEEKNKETISYRFLISNNDDIFNKEIFAKILSSTDALSIPANTFSPDDKYVFLKETYGGKNSYFVPQAGEEVNFSDLFANKYEDYVITDPKFVPPTQTGPLCGDYSKAKKVLGWEPKTTFKELVKIMVHSDLAKFS